MTVIINLLAYEDGTECSETSVYKIQTPGNYPKENIQHTYIYPNPMPPIYIYMFYLFCVFLTLRTATKKSENSPAKPQIMRRLL